jgi:1,4-alpha-glucan branching enzyme
VGRPPYRTPGWDELVVYEMHIGTFNDQPGGGPGTFAAAVERLPYPAELGVNAIELMPAAEFPGGFCWGYNPSAPFAVETDLGGPPDNRERTAYAVSFFASATLHSRKPT